MVTVVVVVGRNKSNQWWPQKADTVGIRNHLLPTESVKAFEGTAAGHGPTLPPCLPLNGEWSKNDGCSRPCRR